MSKEQTKITVLKELDVVLVKNKIQAKVIDEIHEVMELLFASKRSKLPESYEDKGVNLHYCRYHEGHVSEADSVMSNGVPKGYCKKCISLWNQNNAKYVKPLKEAISIAQDIMFSTDDTDTMIECKVEIVDLKGDLEKAQAKLNNKAQYKALYV